MLLTTLPSAGPIGSAAFRHSARVYRPLLMTAAANVARRRMATATASGAPVNPDKLSSKGTEEPLHQGVEGLHISMYTAFCFCFVSSDTERVLNNGGAGDVLPSPSSTQQIKGDWVLFHPVYSPEELKAVDVSHCDGGPITELDKSYFYFCRVQVLHKTPEKFSDKFAFWLVKLSR
jgi:hypothetical protein